MRRGSIAAMILEAVKKEVDQQISRYAMARDRKEFIEKLQPSMVGMLQHFLRIKLAEENGVFSNKISKWNSDKEHFYTEFVINLTERRTKTKFNRKKASLEAFKDVEYQYNYYFNDELRKMRENTKKKLKTRGEDWKKEFFTTLWRSVENFYG